ncbi:MAG: DEAD/DEAH box helicase [Chloroflexi bacterium]|nr:DEAD/DEAH box helicase [Chloroflexota bacterium]
MTFTPENPLIVQGDKTVLLEVNNPRYEAARDALARFAELEKSPEHIHTYRLTPLSLWNAAAAGETAEAMINALVSFGKYDLPENVRVDILDYVSRYGRLKLFKDGERLLLNSQDTTLITEITNHKRAKPFILEAVDAHTLRIDPTQRGHLKQALVLIGYPVEDLAGYVDGAHLPLQLRETTRDGEHFGLRRYQSESVDVFYAAGSARGGSGVIVLPCGAGKTVVGIGALARMQTSTLILTTSTVAVRQWIDEILDKTSLTAEDVGEYTGDVKEIKPVTISTYQIMTYRSKKTDEFPHFALFDQRDWGLIIYDEVHLLPAPVFRVTAEIQSRRRLGLTATLVREDGRETDVFSLIGPKKFDVPWKDLEKQGWIATAECHEVRLPMPESERMAYAVADERDKYRIAAENPFKVDLLKQLLIKHRDDNVLVIGQYIDQLELIARETGAPIITGKTPTRERERLYNAFRAGEQRLMIVSKVANFAIDLPDANVAIQVSGTYGSRQEEAQRLGRILRPKRNGLLAHFYSLVSRDTRDQEFAAKRQLFLTEQGYRYDILYDHEVAAFQPAMLAGIVAAPAPKLLN